MSRFRCTPQGGDGVRGPLGAPPGGSVTVNIGPNDSSVTVIVNANGDAASTPVTPGKDTSIPIPVVPPGTLILIEVGRGLNKRVIPVEVIAPGP